MAKLIVKDGRLCIVNGRLVTDADGAPCVCDGEPPVFGDWCFVQIFRCSCWDASQSRWFPAHRLYVDGQIKPVYVIDGQCWYTGRAVVLTPNFETPGFPFYIGDIGPGVVGPWFETCTDGGCTTNQCPCVGANRLWTSRRNVCGPPNIQVCARYVTLDFSLSGTVDREYLRNGCSTLRLVSSSSASGRIVFDIWTGSVREVAIVNAASANGQVPAGTVPNPCASRAVNYTFSRSIGLGDTFGAFNAWEFFQSVMSGTFASRNNSFGATTANIPVLDPDRSPDHEFSGYQAPSGTGCLLIYSSPTASHTAGRNPFSETVSWQEVDNSSVAPFVSSGSRSYALSFSADLPASQPGSCPGAVLGQPCSGSGAIGIDVLGSALNAADFNRAAIVGGRCYTPEPDIAASGVVVDEWAPNCADPACGDEPPPPGGDGGDATDSGDTLEPGGPRLSGDALLEAMGFDPEAELRRVRAGGCCGQPGA